MKYVFTGAQGTGKTTLIEHLKPNISSNYSIMTNMTRYIQERGYTINQDSNDSTQTAIMNAHTDFLKLPNLISDRCVIDCFCYTWYLRTHGKCSDSLYHEQLRLVANHVDQYDIIFYIEPEFDVIGDGVRSPDSQFRNNIAERFKVVIDKLAKPAGANIVQISGSIDERLTQIKQHIGDNI